MKTVITTIACALALTSSVAFAHPTTTEDKTNANKVTSFETSAYVAKDASIRLALKKNVPGRVYVQIRNAKGEIIYAETVGKNEMNFAAKLNVSELADGVYTLEIISKNGERITKKFNLESAKEVIDRHVTVQ
jgi:methionine-rich copper-binding protein CopC